MIWTTLRIGLDLSPVLNGLVSSANCIQDNGRNPAFSRSSHHWMFHWMNISDSEISDGRLMFMYLNAVMSPAKIKMVKMILCLFNPVLMMSPPALILQAEAVSTASKRKQLSLCLLKPQQPEMVLLSPRKIIAMFAKKHNLK